jgi:D-amino-acid dehydrogenase
MVSRVTVIGAGVVGPRARRSCKCAATPSRSSIHVRPGILPVRQRRLLQPRVVRAARLAGLWRHVPGWLLDPSGPLTIRWRHGLSLVPWLWRFQRASSTARVNRIADALHALLTVTLDKWRPLAARRVPELIVQDGYAFAYESATAFAADALGRQSARRTACASTCCRPDIVAFDAALSPRLTHLVVLPEQGIVRIRCGCRARSPRVCAKAAHGSSGRPPLRSDVVAGRVTAVRAPGVSIATDAVVVAAGVHSAALARNSGTVPLESSAAIT